MSYFIDENSVQRYADKDAFDGSRVSVIRGQVQSTTGTGLKGIRVGVANHASFGFSVTREYGWFDILVNGGGAVTLHFQREPFQALHKTVVVPWNDIVVIDKVTMHIDKHHLQKQTLMTCREHNYKTMTPLIFNSDLKSHNCNESFESSTSTIETDSLTESIPIYGTKMKLVYQSSRSSGYYSTLELRLTPQKISPFLKLVHLKIIVAGIKVEKVFESDENIEYKFVWNRRNVYKQKVYGFAKTTISVGYEYSKDVCEQIIWEKRVVKMHAFDINISEIGDWNLDIHHRLNFQDSIVHKGDGSNIYMNSRSNEVRNLMGDGLQREVDCQHCDGLVNEQQLLTPIAVAAAPDGSVYIGDFNLIRRIKANGEVSTVVELSPSQVAHKYYFTVSPVDGKLYISDPERYQILRVLNSDSKAATFDKQHNVEVVVGSGAKCLPGIRNKCGDGRNARDARLAYPKGIVVTSNNEIFIADAMNIRMVDKNGVIHTIIGSYNHLTDWKPIKCIETMDLNEIHLRWPTELAINPVDNSLHILDDNLVLRLTPDERLQIVAGFSPLCQSKLDNQTTNSQQFLESPQSIAFNKFGDLFIAESDSETVNRIRIFKNSGEAKIYAGIESNCSCLQTNCECFNKESNALKAEFNTISSISVNENGFLYVCDQGNIRIRTVASEAAILSENQEYHIRDKDQVYIFNRYGLHIATKNASDGKTIYEFTYTDKSSNGKLSSVMDSRKIKVYLLRDHRHQAISLESPLFGHFKLTFNKNRKLQSVEAINANKVSLDYYENNGLLKSRIDYKGTKFDYIYDTNGRFKFSVNSNGEQLNANDLFQMRCSNK
ncbi:teneurin-m-like protein [Leptotrombidium deliense]|uniref:Teneurin-m-like protein n=1 Tax=Leptotrombidium deliense TaxID=299467 RepID=A0A443SDG6_9ACAR|nr:teneurin-m-like protein [Leptotrombidium deliense]